MSSQVWNMLDDILYRLYLKDKALIMTNKNLEDVDWGESFDKSAQKETYVEKNNPDLDQNEHVLGYEETVEILAKPYMLGSDIHVKVPGKSLNLTEHLLDEEVIPEDFISNYEAYDLIKRVISVKGILLGLKFRVVKK